MVMTLPPAFHVWKFLMNSMIPTNSNLIINISSAHSSTSVLESTLEILISKDPKGYHANVQFILLIINAWLVNKFMFLMFGKRRWMETLVEKVWQTNRSTKRLLIVTTNLDGFSLANCWWSVKFTKVPPPIWQTFPPYGIRHSIDTCACKYELGWSECLCS